jgi:DNA-binding transcriptional regulator YhcF (GntR family)
MTADGNGLPKYARVAAAVRGQIADGTLRPGQPAPSGAALSRVTGYSTLTCRRALRVLIADGVLIPGPSRNARPRVAGGAQRAAERNLAAASRALSAGLAARRRANRLTQPELAGLTGVSVTTIGHAETGRLWQSRRFWERADAVLSADGGLLRLHDAYREAGTAGQPGPGSGEEQQDQPAGRTAVPADAAPSTGPARSEPAQSGGYWRRATGRTAPASVTIVWDDGTVTTVHPPGTTQPGIPRQTSPRPETCAGGGSTG